jgi:DNA-binding beta-propeller fold protein YncE
MPVTPVNDLHASDASKKRNQPMSTVLRIVLTLVIAGMGIAGGIAAYLAYPGTPSRSKSMAFDGFIELPKEGLLNVLDYLTLSDHTLFVASESSGSVFKVDLDMNRLPASAVSVQHGTGAAHGVVLLPDMNLAFVTRSESNKVDVFDPRSLVQLASIPVADDADALHYLASSKLLYVANGDPKLATLIDPAKRATVGTITLPGKPEFAAFDSQSGWLYQNLVDTDSLVAIDVEKRVITGQWSLSPCKGPSGMAIDTKQRRLFSVCSKNATLVVFDLDTHRIVASLKIGGGPDSVAFDPTLHRIYSAGIAGELTIIQQDGPDSYRVLDRIHTHYGAHTLAVDPISHKVFVAYASLLVAPRIAVFTPQI